MTHNIIKTENYLLIVSDEIPTTWYYDTYINKVRHTGGAEYGESSITKKVIGHLPLNNSPVLEFVPLLPPLEDDEAINKAKEKYKYTEFDIIKAFEYGWNQRHYGIIDENELLKIQKRFIQSLQQPNMPVEFECEWTTKQMPEFHQDGPKITTNPQGQTVLVGKYIY